MHDVKIFMDTKFKSNIIIKTKELFRIKALRCLKYTITNVAAYYVAKLIERKNACIDVPLDSWQ